jgi:methyl-accepting chemotaxis protein
VQLRARKRFELLAQYEAASAYIKSQAHAGWALIHSRYDDGGYSGGSTDRPDLQRLLDDIRSRFLGPIERTIRQLLIGLAILILAAGVVSAWLARRVIATPLITVVDELKHIARLDLEKVRRHASRLIEIENLSNAIADMAGRRGT